MVVAGTHIETHSTGNAVLLGIVHQQMGNADTVEHFVSRLFRGFRDNWLVRFTVDHDLPAPFTLVGARLRVAHQRQTPFFEQVHRRIDVTRHIERQVFTNHAHQVDSRIAYVVFRVVLPETSSHVAVDRIKTLCHRPGTVDVRLLSDNDLFALAPISGLKGCAGPTEAGPADQDVDVVFYNGLVFHQ